MIRIYKDEQGQLRMDVNCRRDEAIAALAVALEMTFVDSIPDEAAGTFEFGRLCGNMSEHIAQMYARKGRMMQ